MIFLKIFLTCLPPLLWQTYKTCDLPPRALEAQSTWLTLNPEFSYSLWDDRDIEHYLTTHWPPEFLTLFHSLPIGAMKADLWRYLILATDGGVYSDIDSLCLRPIRDWPLPKDPPRHLLFLDLDCDETHFCQWTLAATPRHPALLYLSYYLLKQWKEQNGLLYSSDGKVDVLATTGPTLFSNAIKSYLGEPPERRASEILRHYQSDPAYQKRLHQLGLFLAPKGFFHGEATQNLFWGTWSHRTADQTANRTAE